MNDGIEPTGPLTDGTGTAGAGAGDQKKRSRIRFSCTHCREKKLKCNRAMPCDQCEKRAITDRCQYVPYEDTGDSPSSPPARHGPSRARQATNQESLQGRIRHLERLISILKAQRKEAEDGKPKPRESSEQLHPADDPNLPSQPTALDPRYSKLTETTGSMVGHTRYVDSANWQAILEDITKIADDLKVLDGTGTSVSPVAGFEEDLDKKEGPVLLLGSFARLPTSEMVQYLPPRNITDMMIARFFQGKEPAWMIFHKPTFLKQYDEFWKSPEEATYIFLGLIFMMISHAALFCVRGDEQVPPALGPPLQVVKQYRDRAAHCLALDDYTKPGRYKVETMILYFGNEYLRDVDARLGTSVLLSVTLRLAMHAGYHRDPKNFTEITVFEGEMRRRVWVLLDELDKLISFQFGLPTNIQSRYCDTEPPRNLFDEDFGESSTELPPSRPETDRTPALYNIVKARLVAVFGDILSLVNSRVSMYYEDALAVDKKLEQAHGTLPGALQYRPFNRCLADPVEVIMQRYWLEILYQKCRCVLHRRFLGLARISSRYAYSRWTCIDAATKTLQHQYDIYAEMQPGGRLARERWFVSSLSTHDFLLADVILCLELSYGRSAGAHNKGPLEPVKEADPGSRHLAVLPKEQLLEILRTSRSIWQSQRHDSAEASRAFKIVSRMLASSTGNWKECEGDPEPEATDPAPLDLQQPPSFLVPDGVGAGGTPKAAGSGFGFPHAAASASAGPSTAPASMPSAILASSQTPWGSEAAGSTESSATANIVSGGDVPMWGTPQYASTPEAGMSQGLDGVIHPHLTADWTLWDNQVQNPSGDIYQTPWSNFFPPPGG